MKRVGALLMLLTLCSFLPVGHAKADTLILAGKKFTLSDAAENAGDVIFAQFSSSSQNFNPGAGVLLIDAQTGGISDVLFYSKGPTAATSGFIFESATAAGISGNFAGYSRITETGKLQNVGGFFGLGEGQLKVRSALTPLPPAWTLMLLGLAGAGFFLYRRGRQQERSGALAAAAI